ncbi:MAG: TAXI family TRAP transporter solute-binding subunit [Chitinophagaceae bacterium]|nr:TAXI family TRAP transporter solute-binding subunit [Chitinophagaceae bacterium]
MRNKKIISGTLVLLFFSSLGTLLLLSFLPRPASQMTILSGSKNATQYRFVQDIINIVAPTLDFKIQNKETEGVAYNFSELTDPKTPYKLAIMQADYLYYMQAQDMQLKMEKTKHLKVVLPLGDQQIHLVTSASRGYTGLKDLDGKTVAIGNEGQGTFRTALMIRERSKVSYTSRNIPLDESLTELKLGKIDAFFIASSAPIPQLDINPQSMVDMMTLVPLEDFNDWAKYYKRDTIYKTDYKWLDHDIPTYGVPTLLVVNESKLTEEDRASVTKLKAAIQTNYEQLKEKGHPEWKRVNFSDWSESDWPNFK